MMMEIVEGCIIEGPFWPEPIKVDKVERIGKRIHIIGATIRSNRHIDQLLSKEDLQRIKVQETALSFDANGYQAFLAIEAIRFRYASLYDPLLAVNISKIDPLPFQIDAVYGHILKLPRIRFLLADDPGAGKTIMAGLVLKELKLRGLVKRTLVVVPGHLKDQWRRELKEKFQETFTVIDRSTFQNLFGENPWDREMQAITSMDFAKQEDILPSLQSSDWDFVIVDEAHKMAAYRYGEKMERTARYKLGEALSQRSNHLLFLTATPHKGDPENFRLFLDLLSPGYFSTTELLDESIRNRDNPLFLRRLKEDMRDFEGKPIFTNRYVRTIRYRLSDEEKELYNEVSRYVRYHYNLAMEKQEKRRLNITFALIILQRRLASSTYALRKSLQRRKERLEELIKEKEIEPTESFIPLEQLEEVDDEAEQERWEKEEKWERVSTAERREQVEEEIRRLDELIRKADEILQQEKEVKLKQLRRLLEEGLEQIRKAGGKDKILVFTESKDTLEYLVNKIKSWGYSVNYIHGGMSLEDRIEAEKVFRDETQVMVATEAAGEGINLQFCNYMINYDIPWNPVRLEQRMGRIHRYGQQRDVYIFNLVAEDTREGGVLAKILEKLEEIRNALGTDRVFDVIGELFFGKDLYQLVIEAALQQRTLEEIQREVDIKIDEKYIEQVKNLLGESLATRFIDYTMLEEFRERAREHRLVPEYVEAFFKEAFSAFGGKFKETKDGFLTIENIPYEIRQITEDVNFRNTYGIIPKKQPVYSRVTFDKEIALRNPDAELITFGHPLLEALIERVLSQYLPSLNRGAAFEDPSWTYEGVIWFFEGEIRDGKGEVAGKKLFAIYDDGEEMKEINPAIIWDLKPMEKPHYIQFIAANQEEAEETAIEALERYREQLREEREKQAKIKRKYGLKSLEMEIEKLDEELVWLESRREHGEEVDLVIENKSRRKRELEERLKNLEQEIEREMSLTISTPRLLGAIRVDPMVSEEEMVSDEEIERLGMEIAMAYERREGREPEDVSQEGLGYDIRSKGKEEVRFIEVKARRREGEIALTPNEWFKARRFGRDYWLYIVANAVFNPTLYIIRDPAGNLEVIEKVEVVRFIVPDKEWKRKGKPVFLKG
jgi:superfamily II DNA or RNA helicase